MAQLPKMKIGKKSYFVDERLEQLRNVANPHDFIDYSSSLLDRSSPEERKRLAKVFEDLRAEFKDSPMPEFWMAHAPEPLPRLTQEQLDELKHLLQTKLENGDGTDV